MYLNNAKTVSPQANQFLDSQTLCLAMLEEQRKSRRWSNLFKAVTLTIVTVFLMAIYSNQYTITQAKLTNSGICTNELKVNDGDEYSPIFNET